MTKEEALKLALEALEISSQYSTKDTSETYYKPIITTIKEALAQPEPKYHRGNRLICLETEEYCVIHISGTDRQWVKFPDSYIGVYTNEQVAELFELLPKELEQEPVAWMFQHEETGRMMFVEAQQLELGFEKGNPRLKKIGPLYTTPPQRKPLTDEEILNMAEWYGDFAWQEASAVGFCRAIEAAVQEKQK